MSKKEILKGKVKGDRYFSVMAPEEMRFWSRENKWPANIFDYARHVKVEHHHKKS
jgi:hypothetical protein